MKMQKAVEDALGGVSPELRALLDQIKERRGSHEDWMKLEMACMARIAACTPNEHVWCRGEVHGRSRHYPAIVVFDRDTRELKVLAPSGEEGAMEEHGYHFFCSSVPHIGIVREVMSGNDTSVVVTD
jgi:hypothetical protein